MESNKKSKPPKKLLLKKDKKSNVTEQIQEPTLVAESENLQVMMSDNLNQTKRIAQRNPDKKLISSLA